MKFCFFCGKESEKVVCPSCLGKFNIIEPKCRICGKESERDLCRDCAIKVALRQVDFKPIRFEIDEDLKALAESVSLDKWVLVTGRAGSGKTTLLRLIAERICREKPFLAIDNIFYLSYPRFIEQYQAGTHLIAYEKALTVRFLFIDDAYNYYTADFLKRVFFNIINERYEAQAFTAVSMPIEIDEALKIDEQSVSRMLEMSGGAIFTGNKNRRLRR